MVTVLTITSILVLLLAVGAYFLFRDTLNRVQYFPFHTNRVVYWITRDSDHVKWGKSFMRMTSYPWLRGDGFTFKLPFGRSFQVGVATRYTYEDEQEALRQALGARDLELDVDKIREEFKSGYT